MAEKLPVYGTAVGLDLAGGTGYTEIADLVAIMPGSLKQGTVESTVMDSPSRYREFMATMKDGGEFTMRLRFGEDEYDNLKDAYDQGSCPIPSWIINFPLLCTGGQITSANLVFDGIVTELSFPEKSIEGDNLYENNVTVKISGPVVFNIGT